MSVGRWRVDVGRSMWVDWRPHWFDGRRMPPLLRRLDGPRPVWMRGMVFALGPWMVWVTWEV